MTTIYDICDAIGRAKLARKLGVSRAAVTNSLADGQFPSRWFRVVREECKRLNIECQEDLFGFISPASKVKTDALKHVRKVPGAKR